MTPFQADSEIKSKVVVIGAGFYGLVAAKTYLQVTGAYATAGSSTSSINSEKSQNKDGEENDVLVIDSASDIGGTWAHERLYPNLRAQNSYGFYEFSDLPLAEAVPDVKEGEDKNDFIPGWKLNQYLHVWCRKWHLEERTRLRWRVSWLPLRIPADNLGHSSLTTALERMDFGNF